MPRIHRVAFGLTLCLSAAAAAQEPSLRERIEAARAAARARAEAELAEKGIGADATQEALYDPRQDPEVWRIRNFDIPVQRALGFYMAGGDESRFYANAPRAAVDGTLGEGATVYFYELDDAGLRLAGRGTVRKLRGKRSEVVVEAKIESFLHSRKVPPAAAGLPPNSPVKEVLALVKGKNPHAEEWYMSAKLVGPDVEGWGLDELQKFALGQPWKGMTEQALLATLGNPTQQLRIADQVALVYGEGASSVRYTIVDGVVTERTQGLDF